MDLLSSLPLPTRAAQPPLPETQTQSQPQLQPSQEPAAGQSPPPVEKPYHSKRPHKKSRSGCRNCKTRKVKCDEVRPVCRSCRLRKAECVYPNPPASSSTAVANVSPASPAASLASRTSHRAPSPDAISISSGDETGEDAGPLLMQPLFRPGVLDNADMRLLWFYTSSTCNSFSIDDGRPNPVTEILKTRMVQVAFENPFLMDSLFALASLHMQSLSQECDPSRALAYRARSFEGYRRAVENSRPETYPALIANSLLLTALSSQNFRDDDAKELYIIDWMVVWRGIGLVIDLMGIERLFDSGLYALFNRPPVDLDLASSAIPSNLLFMVSSIQHDDPDYIDVETYYETLKYLGSLYYNLNDGINPVMLLRVITWFTFVPRHFVQLSRERRPRALVILAYYSIFLKLTKTVWWLRGIGDRSLRDICEYLGTEWQHLLAVPQMARHVHTELDLARVLYEDPTWTPKTPSNLRLDPTAAITLVDDTGRRVEWTPSEKRLVLMDPKADETLDKWKCDAETNWATKS
ncbi:Sterol regulatory element-binding ECM22 [Fusarium albosuccineum]|uniref:Sterol regulatory element-binding ECM22 n=1 Tax=Fusarium albosuccineum TaxID=1237068 RepID=A0A8H4KIQ3_9HYPO|nr:Sterol regulatory element-binding ECM22 [Fusarium albosuccineum]KAF5011489.1 hypothetical protein FDECE_2408 [Fusarium decemcellulare]